MKKFCGKCPKEATGGYSPNKGETALYFCDEHKEIVAAAFYCLMTDDIEKFNILMETDINQKQS